MTQRFQSKAAELSLAEEAKEQGWFQMNKYAGEMASLDWLLGG